MALTSAYCVEDRFGDQYEPFGRRASAALRALDTVQDKRALAIGILANEKPLIRVVTMHDSVRISHAAAYVACAGNLAAVVLTNHGIPKILRGGC
jgi:hypothetical protein